MRADLHVHTTASDGLLTPTQIVSLAVKQQLDIIAITDHDSVSGIDEAIQAAAAFPLKIIPGVEINTDVPHGEVHILGYFIDYHDTALNITLGTLRSSRENRATAMLKKLEGLGVEIGWQRVKELAHGGSIGRPHVAKALLEKGYVGSLKEAFDKYIGREGPAYVEREKITPVAAVGLVVQAGGLPVLAHPADIYELEHLLPLLKKSGLVGLEVWYNNYTSKVKESMNKIASNYDLIATGGTDYHGFGEKGEIKLGEVIAPHSSVIRLFARAGESL